MSKYTSHILTTTTQAAKNAMRWAGDSKFVEFNKDDGDFPLHSNDIWIGPREHLETMESMKQIIPYTIITRDDKILVYARTPKGNEKRLHNQLSIGFGGHIDVQDIAVSKSGESIDLHGTIGNAVEREITEELKTDSSLQFEALGMILDESDAVGRVHFGFVMVATVSGMVLSREDKIELIGFKTVAELSKMVDACEGWSRIIIEHLVEKELLEA